MRTIFDIVDPYFNLKNMQEGSRAAEGTWTH